MNIKQQLYSRVKEIICFKQQTSFLINLRLSHDIVDRYLRKNHCFNDKVKRGDKIHAI